MTAAARMILAFRMRAEDARYQARTLPVWGLHPRAEQYWETHGVVYRVKDMISDESYATRCERAADWLEARAGADTLRTLYPALSIR